MKIPLSIIRAAKADDPQALSFIFKHRSKLIARESTVHFVDRYGVERSYVNEDLYAIGIMALYQAIKDFDIEAPPESST